MALKNDWADADELTNGWANLVAKMLNAGASVDAAGTGDLTLTAAQYDPICLTLTGILTGARNIIVPADTRLWCVFNNTTGAFTLTVKTAAGTGIAVGTGKRAILGGDGTNVVRWTADL